MKEKELQRKYIQAQLIKQQINAMIEQKNAVDEKMQELAVSLHALSKIDEMKRGEEIWSTIGSGAFVRSDIKDIDNVLVSIGADVIAKKPRSRASEILKERLEELKKINLQIMEEVTGYAQQVEQLESEIESLAEELHKQEQKAKKKGK